LLIWRNCENGEWGKCSIFANTVATNISIIPGDASLGDGFYEINRRPNGLEWTRKKERGRRLTAWPRSFAYHNARAEDASSLVMQERV
jgi:hypothetical protein